MNYTPQTRWVGGHYPGALPAHLHHVDVEQRIRNRAFRPPVRVQASPARTRIFAAVCTHGPVSLAQLSSLLDRNSSTMYARLRSLERLGLVTKESCKGEHNNRRSMYYSGVK